MGCKGSQVRILSPRFTEGEWSSGAMDFGPQHIGKLLIFFGLIIVLIGAIVILLGQLGLFKLPGDLQFGSKNWRIFIPITSCIIISIVLTLILWLINYLRR
jgi:hypothetical protein